MRADPRQRIAGAFRCAVIGGERCRRDVLARPEI
jgi:hypothetical protein